MREARRDFRIGMMRLLAPEVSGSISVVSTAAIAAETEAEEKRNGNWGKEENKIKLKNENSESRFVTAVLRFIYICTVEDLSRWIGIGRLRFGDEVAVWFGRKDTVTRCSNGR